MKFTFLKSVPIYVLLYKNRLKVYRLDNGKSIDRSSSKPFSNNRLLLGDFQRFEVFLKDLIKHLFKEDNYFLSPVLSILMHQMEIKEDGITEVEKRALIDSGKHVNAKEVYLCFEDNELTLKKALSKIKNKEGTWSIHNYKE